MSEQEQLEQAIAALEAQRALLGDPVVEAALAPMREKLAGLIQAKSPPPALQGERRMVTILFADLAGWTELASAIDPEAARNMMNSVFAVLVPIIEKYEGTVDKFIGDEIMALFGAPIAHENDPVRALYAALEMQIALAQFNAAHGTRLGLHYGINTGLVIAGGIGTEGRQEYSVLGDAVNLAARLTGAAEVDEILVGSDTYRLTAPLFEFTELPPIALKGKSEPVPAYRLLGVRQRPGSLRGIAGLSTPMVGRGDQLAQVQAAFRALAHGQGGQLLIVGEAGLGKSRLVAEARQTLPVGLGWAEGRALSHTHGMSYWVARDLLHRLLGTHPELAPAEVSQQLQRQLAKIAPAQASTLYPPLARLLDLPLEPALAQELEQGGLEHVPQRIREAFTMLIELWSRREPLVLVCEDLHWVDPSSWQLLMALMPLTTRAALLLIGVSRPDLEGRGEQMIQHWGGQVVELAPLSQQESAMLVQHLLRIEHLPDQIRTLVLAKSEGNPFFLEELIRSLFDAGVIVRQGEEIVATRLINDVEVPDTLQGIIMARIDRLAAADKRVLQMAAVIGRIFQRRVLAHLLETGRLEVEQLGSALGTLREREFIRLLRAETPQDQDYIFKHIITQETAYQSLLLSQRKSLHGQAGEAIETLFADRLDELAATLAWHFTEAGDLARASHYLRQAGHQARSLGANLEAIDFYQAALALLKQQENYEEAARVAMLLGMTYQTALRYRESREAYEEGFELWNKAGELAAQTQLEPAAHPLRLVGCSPSTLDPGQVVDHWSGVAITAIFCGLVRLSHNYGFEPEIASSWDILDNGRRYVFHLSETARWSDGQPITAHDVIYAWRRLLDSASSSPLAVILYDIRGARAYHQGDPGVELGLAAPDPTTLIVDLEQPTSHFLTVLTTPLTFPVPRHVVEEYGESWTTEHLVTSGPFLIEQWTPHEQITFRRSPNYIGRRGGNVQQVNYLLRHVHQSMFNELLSLYEANQLDMVGLSDFMILDEIPAVRQRLPEEYVSGRGPITVFLRLDPTQAPFDDLRVRQALALAIDKETMVNQIMHGTQSPALGGFVPPGIAGHAPQIGLPYDPERARQLLAEAGYPQGQGFPTISAMAGSNRTANCTYLAEQWRQVLGIEVAWGILPLPSFFSDVRLEWPPMFIMTWAADYDDADNFLRVAIGHWERREHPHYTRLIEQARITLDQPERLRLLQQADQILMEDAAIIPLYYLRVHGLLKPWLIRRGDFWKDWIIKPHD